MPAKKTFWERVEKTESCWLWRGGHRRGYGRLRVNGKFVYAYEEAYGTVPDGQKALHRCDDPPCVRPDHLVVGTQKDNVLDAVKKQRHKNPVLLGENNPSAVHSDNDITAMRRLYKAGSSKEDLMRRFVDYIDLLGPPRRSTTEDRALLEETRELVKNKAFRVVVPVSDLVRRCDRCHKLYVDHPVDADGVYDVCGWLVVLREHSQAQRDEIAYSDAIERDTTILVQAINDRPASLSTIHAEGAQEEEGDDDG